MMILRFGASEKTRDLVPLRKEVKNWVEVESQRATKSSRTRVQGKKVRLKTRHYSRRFTEGSRKQRPRRLFGFKKENRPGGVPAGEKSASFSMLMLCPCREGGLARVANK